MYYYWVKLWLGTEKLKEKEMGVHSQIPMQLLGETHQKIQTSGLEKNLLKFLILRRF